MFLSLSLVTLLLSFSLSISCPFATLQESPKGTLKICVRLSEDQYDWLHPCSKFSENVVLCQEGHCQKFTFDFNVETDQSDCCTVKTVVRMKNDTYFPCDSEKDLCPKTDRVLCAPKVTVDRKEEYILGGCIVVMTLVGVFVGWMISFYYWAIRKPRIDNNIDEMIQTRLETNTYALIAPAPYLKQNGKKPSSPVKSISPENSSLLSGTKDKCEDITTEKEEKSVEGGSLNTTTEAQLQSKVVDSDEGNKEEQGRSNLTKVEKNETFEMDTVTVLDKQNADCNTDQEVIEAETVCEQEGSVICLLEDTTTDSIQGIQTPLQTQGKDKGCVENSQDSEIAKTEENKV